MKILNLFAGIGGNRSLWGDEHYIEAVEFDEEIGKLYKKRFPNDAWICQDAYKYLIDNYKRFDFIWASPPCPTHSQLQFCQKKKRLPDMRLYSLIIFLKHHFHGKWVVENVQGYYKPLIQPIKIGRHYIWSNLMISPKNFKRKYTHEESNIERLKEEYHAEDVDLFKGYKHKKILRNMVKPELGKYILDSLIKPKQKSIINKYI